MELIVSIVLGFLFGVLASWVFWKYLLWQRPNVAIAPKIAVETDSNTGRKIYRFKIYNNGNNQVIDITFKAWVCDLLDVPGGKVSRGLFHFPIENSTTRALSPKTQSFQPWSIAPVTTFRTMPDFDVAELLEKPNHRIMAVLRVSDAHSGTTIVQQETYTKSDIVNGAFDLGENMDVIEIRS